MECPHCGRTESKVIDSRPIKGGIAILIGFYYIAWGDKDEGLSTYLTIYTINEDAGAAGEQLVETLQTAKWEGLPLFEVIECMPAFFRRQRTAIRVIRMIGPSELDTSTR